MQKKGEGRNRRLGVVDVLCVTCRKGVGGQWWLLTDRAERRVSQECKEREYVQIREVGWVFNGGKDERLPSPRREQKMELSRRNALRLTGG